MHEITHAGRVTVLTGMREMLSTSRAEFSRFPAAIAYPLLPDTDDLAWCLGDLSDPNDAFTMHRRLRQNRVAPEPSTEAVRHCQEGQPGQGRRLGEQ